MILLCYEFYAILNGHSKLILPTHTHTHRCLFKVIMWLRLRCDIFRKVALRHSENLGCTSICGKKKKKKVQVNYLFFFLSDQLLAIDSSFSIFLVHFFFFYILSTFFILLFFFCNQVLLVPHRKLKMLLIPKNNSKP